MAQSSTDLNWVEQALEAAHRALEQQLLQRRALAQQTAAHTAALSAKIDEGERRSATERRILAEELAASEERSVRLGRRLHATAHRAPDAHDASEFRGATRRMASEIKASAVAEPTPVRAAEACPIPAVAPALVGADAGVDAASVQRPADRDAQAAEPTAAQATPLAAQSTAGVELRWRRVLEACAGAATERCVQLERQQAALVHQAREQQARATAQQQALLSRVAALEAEVEDARRGPAATRASALAFASAQTPC